MVKEDEALWWENVVQTEKIKMGRGGGVLSQRARLCACEAREGSGAFCGRVVETQLGDRVLARPRRRPVVRPGAVTAQPVVAFERGRFISATRRPGLAVLGFRWALPER